MKISLIRLIFLTGFVLSLSFNNFAQQIDTGFGVNGFVKTSFRQDAFSPRYSETAIQAFKFSNQEAIIVITAIEGVSFKAPRTNEMVTAIYDSAGNFAGVNSYDLFRPFDAVQQPDGKILVAGFTYKNLNFPQTLKQIYNWRIVRLNSDGTLDTSFGNGGKVDRIFSDINEVLYNIAIQPNGKIIVSGTSENSAGITATVIAKYNADGTIDNSFGPYGEGFIDLWDGGILSKKLAIQPDGKMILAGDNSNPANTTGDIFLTRLTADGLIDTTFANGGGLVFDFQGNSDRLADMKTQTDGKILIGGNTRNSIESSQILIRLTQNGAFDTTFNGGIITNDLSFNSDLNNDEITQAIKLRENGNVVVAANTIQIKPQIGFSGFTTKNVLQIIEFDTNGRIIGRNFTRLTPANQIIQTSVNTDRPLDIKNIFLPNNSGVLLLGSAVIDPGSFADVGLAKFAALSAKNDAKPFYDLDNDGRDDISVIRPGSDGKLTWYSQIRRFPTPIFVGKEFGAAGDIPVPADYNGDFVSDMAVFHPKTGEWIFNKLNYKDCSAANCVYSRQWGQQDDVPVPGDYDGDGKADLAVFRPSDGVWYISKSSGGFQFSQFGFGTDLPVPGDYDGDGKTDIAVIRNQNGVLYWYIWQSSQNNFVAVQFGAAEDIAVAGDFTGNGKSDVAVWRPSTQTFYVLSNYTDFTLKKLGAAGDIPIPADYDNDHQTDFAVFTPSGGTHRIILSASEQIIDYQFGQAGDIPLAAVYNKSFR